MTAQKELRQTVKQLEQTCRDYLSTATADELLDVKLKELMSLCIKLTHLQKNDSETASATNYFLNAIEPQETIVANTIVGVLVEPDKPACVVRIGSDYESLCEAVQGEAEFIYCLNDHQDRFTEAVVVRDEYAENKRKPFCRRLSDDCFINGSFIIIQATIDKDCNTTYKSLTVEQISKYMRAFAKPESI